MPKNLSGETLCTAEVVVFGDVVDADSFVAAGNGRNFIGNFCAAAAEKADEDSEEFEKSKQSHK